MTTTDRMLAEDLLEMECGSRIHKALLVTEAQAACEHAYEEFRYVEEFPADVLEALRVVSKAELYV